jgi:hypothetical protein
LSNVQPVRTAKWVNITRLSYGIPNEAIAGALKPYGKVIHIKMDSFHGVYVGVRRVLMELSKPIPPSTSTLPPSSAAVSSAVVQPSSRKDSDNSDDDDVC